MRLVLSGSRAGATAARLARDGGSLILAPSAGWVRRSAGTVPYSEQYANLRREVGKILAVPESKVLEGGRVLIEDFVPGTLLSETSSDERDQKTAYLVEALARFLPLGDGPTPEERAVLDSFSPDIREFCVEVGADGQRCSDEFAQFPLVTSLGDLRPENIVLRHGSPVVIDIDPGLLRARPFWFDTLFLLMHSSPQSVLDPRVAAMLKSFWSRGTTRRAAPDPRTLAAMVCVWSHPLLRISSRSVSSKAKVSVRNHARRMWQEHWADVFDKPG